VRLLIALRALRLIQLPRLAVCKGDIGVDRQSASEPEIASFAPPSRRADRYRVAIRELALCQVRRVRFFQSHLERLCGRLRHLLTHTYSEFFAGCKCHKQKTYCG
jgi:hypothetical protein